MVIVIIYANICVPDVIKDLNAEVFNLMSRTNETRFTKWHEKCKCECRLDAIICNNKITECNEINSVNPLYLKIKDMKGQFKKGDNVWYLIIFGDANVL